MNKPIYASQNVAVVLLRDNHEIQFFPTKKDAGAWLLHVFGLPLGHADATRFRTEYLTNRKPAPGDCVIYDNSGPYKLSRDNEQTVGVLQLFHDRLQVTFNTCPFRDEHYISCVGGPVARPNPDSFTFEGLIQQSFWRWHQGHAGGGERGDYTMFVPLWRWNGTEQ